VADGDEGQREKGRGKSDEGASPEREKGKKEKFYAGTGREGWESPAVGTRKMGRNPRAKAYSARKEKKNDEKSFFGGKVRRRLRAREKKQTREREKERGRNRLNKKKRRTLAEK